MNSIGVVREFDRTAGVGVIDSPDTPGGCWVHFSMIAVNGYRALEPGEEVSFTFEPVGQDGFSYRAVEVQKEGSDKYSRPVSQNGNADSAYSSELKIYPTEP